jgi:hypothetical protein
VNNRRDGEIRNFKPQAAKKKYDNKENWQQAE